MNPNLGNITHWATANRVTLGAFTVQPAKGQGHAEGVKEEPFVEYICRECPVLVGTIEP